MLFSLAVVIQRRKLAQSADPARHQYLHEPARPSYLHVYLVGDCFTAVHSLKDAFVHLCHLRNLRMDAARLE